MSTNEPQGPTAALDARPRGLGGALRSFEVGSLRDYGIVFAFVALFLVLTFSSDVFLTSGNLLNLADQSAALGILACGMTLVIIAGGFDLSIGAIFAVTAIVGAKVTNSSGAELGVLAALTSGMALGLLNGLLATVGRLNPFVATIATTLVFRGLALAISGGFLVAISDASFGNLSQPRVLDVRISVFIFAAFALFCAFLLNRTVYGRHLFAVGGNAEAARLSGVRVNRVRALAYVLMGFASALGGVLVASRTLTVDGNTGTGIEFDAIAAVLVGGTSVMGGEGAIWRTILGVFLLALVGNGFNLLGTDPLYQRIFTGAIIILAVGSDAWIRRGKRA